MINKKYSIALLSVFMCASQPVKADMSIKNKIITTAAVGALGAGGIATVIQWWNLGTRLDELQMCKKVGPLIERNVWLSPYDFTSGYALWGFFTNLGSRKENDKFRQQLLEELCRAEGIDRNAINVNSLVIDRLDAALAVLQLEIDHCTRLTPIMSEMARLAGFAKNPQELISSDYIIDHELALPKFLASCPSVCAHRLSPVERAFHKYMDDRLWPIDIKYTWSPAFGTRIPYWFTWTHKKAAECTFELLQQYARIRSIQRVMEQYLAVNAPSQTVNLNLKHR